MSTGSAALDRLLAPDPSDGGCEQALALLDAYAELVATDPATAAQRYPDIAAHLASCGPCAEDLIGLLQAIGEHE